MDENGCITAIALLGERGSAEALGERLSEMDPAPEGVGVFRLEDGSGQWEVGAYFTESPDEIALMLLEAAFGTRFVISEVPHQDWVAHVRRELAPVEAGRFWLYGSHDAEKLPSDRIGLLIEASMAFGTGHHGTTRGCLEVLDQLGDSISPKRVADIGCGTAVLAMAAKKIYPDAEIIASDIDSVAIEVAEANLSANHLAGKIKCVEAAGFSHAAFGGGIDLIFANILKPPLLALAEEVSLHLTQGTGKAILSGLLLEQADEVVEAYTRQGLTLEARRELGEWATLLLAKP